VHYLTIFGTLLQSALAIKVPLWSALILAIALAYYITRPEPEPQTVIEYRTNYLPPIIKLPTSPRKVVEYAPYPKDQLRVDTIYVPVDMTRYQLWQPEQVQTRDNSIVVRSFDIGTLAYRDYEYRAPQTKFSLHFEAYALYPARVGLDAVGWYRNVGLVGRIEQGESLYYGVGLKYRF
jgi:hypothetical protein